MKNFFIVASEYGKPSVTGGIFLNGESNDI